ncbi:MAG: hypothetical protein LBD02_01300 [Christensenellaceae bacterium]|jgi:hypothetical protein|nr:hypothetical protein [Christensenellaceae bacterium]
MPKLTPRPLPGRTIKLLQIKTSLHAALELLRARGEKDPFKSLSMAARVSTYTLGRRMMEPEKMTLGELIGIASKLGVPIESLLSGEGVLKHVG